MNMRAYKLPYWLGLLACLQVGVHGAVNPSLPRPAGNFYVGRADFDWIDSRPEPLSQTSGARRELLVSLWYPAERGQYSGGEAPYYPGAHVIDQSSEGKSLSDSYGKAWPFIVSGELQTRAIENAPILRAVTRYPVLVFSHGYGASGFEYTALLENLASNGFIVAAVEHTFESAPVLLAGNKVAGMSPLSTAHYAPPGAGISYPQALGKVFAWELDRGNVWADDIRFVLDQLTILNQQQNGSFANRLDLKRIGALGHSLGGRFTIRACQLDQRIRACASLDGSSLRGQYLPYPGAEPPMQPLLFVNEHGTGPAMPPPSDEQLKEMHETREQFDEVTREAKTASDRQLQSCRDKCYLIEVPEAGMTHMSYSDIPILSSYESQPKEEHAVQCLTGLNKIVVSFFNRTLGSHSTSAADVSANDLPSITVTTYGPQ
jgi:dienelactone hydrolase